MKLLFFTDTHIRGKNPSSRIDNYFESLINKFKEIKKIIDKEKIDYVLHGGDLFDRPDISISVVNPFVKILGDYNVPIYMISGNHDIYGHNPKTVNRTILSLLNTTGLIHLINENDKVLLSKNNVNVQLTGQPYTHDIDGFNKEHYIVDKVLPEANYSIHMVHGMLLEKPFLKEVKHTLVNDLIKTKADITLSGHYHSGFKTININGKYFINPGSLIRNSNSISEIKRRPKVVIIEIKNNIKIKNIYLKSPKEGHKVLDRSNIEKDIFKKEKMYDFKQSIDSVIAFDKLDVNDILLEVSKVSNIDETVIKEAIKRVAEVQMKGIDS